jgi:hypothetical protein
MGEAMPAITLWQPWASLIAHGAKRYETRHWSPPARLIGRRIAIHAAARPVPRDFDSALAQAVGSALGRADRRRAPPLGAVVCTVVLAGGYRIGAPCAPDRAAIDAVVRVGPARRARDGSVRTLCPRTLGLGAMTWSRSTPPSRRKGARDGGTGALRADDRSTQKKEAAEAASSRGEDALAGDAHQSARDPQHARKR